MDQVYFAYGSNMNLEQMKKRCPSAQPIGIAVLADHQICFTHFSKKWDSAVADIKHCAGKQVWGILYLLSSEDLSNLDRFEGAPTIYKRSQKQVLKCNTKPDRKNAPVDLKYIDKEFTLSNAAQLTECSGLVNVWIYEVVTKRLGLVPALNYISILQESAYRNLFPDTYEYDLYVLKLTQSADSLTQFNKLIEDLTDLIDNENWPTEIQSQVEWGGANLVITCDIFRKLELEADYPNDIVIYSRYWQELSWLLTTIYNHPTVLSKMDRFNKYYFIETIGKSLQKYLNENSEDNSVKDICHKLVKTCQVLFGGG